MTLVSLITAAVRDNLQRPKPDGLSPICGLAVSGGLDSSTVATVALLMEPELTTFTGWYDVPGFDERAYARRVAGPNHVEVEVTPQHVIDHFDEVMMSAPEPLQGPGRIGQWVVAREASKYVDTLLSGEGSDELFGGYARQIIVAGEEPPAGYEHYRLPDGYPTDLRAALDYDLSRLPDLLAVDDAMCSAWHVEARAPFTDSRIVEYALNLPAAERVGKRHLRQAVRGLVPDEIIDRRDKMGFPIPLVHWGQGPLREFFLDRIGYLPDTAQPFSRRYWNDLCAATKQRLAA